MKGNELDNSLLDNFKEFYEVKDPPKNSIEEIWEKYKPKDFKNIKIVSGWPLLFSILLQSKWNYLAFFIANMITQGI